MTIYRIRKLSMLGVHLNMPGRYKTRAKAEDRAATLNARGGIYRYSVAEETENQRHFAEVVAKARRESRKRGY